MSVNSQRGAAKALENVFNLTRHEDADPDFVATRGYPLSPDQFEKNCEEHIAAYGPDNHLRLTGLHETQSIDQFSWGVADRGASIRVPHSFVKEDQYKGYLEDRRPNSQGDPYQIASRILKTISEVPTA